MATAEPELLDPADDGNSVANGNLTTLHELVRAEIDQQIATAKKYPRSITAFKRNAMALACLDEQTAGSMFYVLPRDGKRIEGPSVRLAEIVGSTWGNLRYGSRVVSIDDKFITAQGACHDLETNNAATVEVKRRITNKSGRRFSDDMIQTTANAACSIALRGAIFKIVPFALVKDIYQNAKQTSIGNAKSMKERRANAFEAFSKVGATKDEVLAFLGHRSEDDITIDDLIVLNGTLTAIKDGDTTVEEALSKQDDAPASKARPSKLNETVGKPKAAKPAPEPPKAPQPVSLDEFKRDRRAKYEMAGADQNELLKLYTADCDAGLTPEQLAFVKGLYEANKGGGQYD